MADSEGQQEGDQGDDRAARLIQALHHEVRRQILRLLHTSEEPRSPARIAEHMRLSLSMVSYHITILRRCGVITRVEERPVRGTIEHFYVSNIGDDPTAQTLLEATRKSDEAR